jgi:hypothetical protein
LYTEGIRTGVGVGVGVGLGVVGTTAGFAVSVAVGVAVGVGVPTCFPTHPSKTEDKIISIIVINLMFFIPSPDLTIVLFINNIIDLFSDSDLLERFINNASHQTYVYG